MELNENMQFGAPVLLWVALAAVPCLLLFFAWAWRRKQAAMAQFIPARLFATLMSGFSPRREKVRYALLGGAVVLGLLALAQPRWGFTWEEVRQKGLDVVVAVDTSRSMLAPDLAPTRLERARLACIDLLRVARTDRLGLVAFAGSAFLQCPLTFDDEAFRLSLGAVDTELIPQGGSSLAEAIRAADEAFKKDEDNHKVLVLLTDGEDHEQGAIEAAKEAAKNGLKIFTIGVGTPNGELLSYRDAQGRVEYVRDDSGNIVRSRLNEDLLREIATVGNGFYLPLSGTKTMETLYEQGLAGLPKSESNSQYIQRFQERFQWPLALLIVLLASEWLLQGLPAESAAKKPAVKTPLPKAALITLLLCLLCAGTAAASPSKARKSFESGNYKAAYEEYSRLSRLKPSDARLHYNTGAAAYRANELDAAVSQFSEALRTPDLELQRDAYYNRGNTRYRQGENSTQPEDKQQMWESALNDYERALKLNPEDQDAKFNRDLVKRKLEELKKQQEQQQQQQSDDSQDKQENKDDKQKQDQKKKDQKGKDQEKKQDQQNQQDQQGNEKSQDQQQARQDKGQEKSKQDENAKKQDEAGKSGEKDKQQAQKQKPESGKEKDGKSAEPAESGEAMMAEGTGEMTLEQAVQLLDELKTQERALKFLPPKDSKAKPKVFKDW